MQELAYRIGILLSSYSQAINKQNRTTGSLFQQKTKVKILSEVNNNWGVNYFEERFHYIHQSSVTATIINDVPDWRYSSYLEYVGSSEKIFVKGFFLFFDGNFYQRYNGKTKEDLNQKILDKIF